MFATCRLSPSAWYDLNNVTHFYLIKSILCFLCLKNKNIFLYSSISPLGLVLKHTQHLVFRGQRKNVCMSHLFLRELSGHGRTLTSAWRPSFCSCVRPCGPETAWPSCRCFPYACSWPCVVHSPPCCLSSSESVWRCPQIGPAHCDEGRQMSQWTCSRIPLHRHFPLQYRKYEERTIITLRRCTFNKTLLNETICFTCQTIVAC